MAEIGDLRTKDLFFILKISIAFWIFCVVTDIVCCGVSPNSPSFLSVPQIEKVAEHCVSQLIIINVLVVHLRLSLLIDYHLFLDKLFLRTI